MYGDGVALPTSETCPLTTLAPYGISKYCAEQYLMLFNRMHGGRHVALRLGNVYGPRQDPHGEAGVVAIFCGQLARGQTPTIYGGGKQTRDYIYVIYVADVSTLFSRRAATRATKQCSTSGRAPQRPSSISSTPSTRLLASSFDVVLADAGITAVRIPPRSPLLTG
jgi:UDP-glucose 4-epimerase